MIVSCTDNNRISKYIKNKIKLKKKKPTTTPTGYLSPY